jgi:predicted N-formylglutamate amidohydrolase
MQPVTLSAPADAPLVLTCEHASAAVPPEYRHLGLSPDVLLDHIGWDIGAGRLTVELNRLLGVPAVMSAASRLLVDCNRDLTDADLIPATSHGIAIPGNAALDTHERRRRVERFYDPYHAAVDAALDGAPRALLLSIHSFTPELNGAARPFDAGVLYDAYDDEAESLAARLRTAGLSVRMNEPYSALDGLIFSARSHGRRHGICYLELEVNNGRLRCDADIERTARQIAPVLSALAAERA